MACITHCAPIFIFSKLLKPAKTEKNNMADNTSDAKLASPDLPQTDLGKFLSAYKERGFTGSIARVLHVLTWRFHTLVDGSFDKRHNVKTSSQVYSWHLNMHSEGDDIGTEEPMYLPTSALAFGSIMGLFKDDLSQFTFIDYGSGKGRTLFLAAEYPFKKVVGIEFAEELHETTVQNIRSFSSSKQQCFDLESWMTDATTAELPAGPCFIYFFNPFEEEAMRKVAIQIAESYRASPRKMYLVYYKPKHAAVIEEQDCFVRSVKRPGLLSLPNPYGLAIYETPSS